MRRRVPNYSDGNYGQARKAKQEVDLMAARRAVAAAAAIGVTAALAGCGGGGSAGDSSDTVTMWTYPITEDKAKHQAFFDEAIKEFHEEHPDIDVKVNIYPWDNRAEALTTAIAGGKGPDVAYLIADEIPKYQSEGALAPVGDYLSESDVSDFRENAREAMSVDGELYGAPILMSATPPLCDKRVFEAAGVEEYPTTWDEFLALGPIFKEKGFYLTQYAADPSITLNQTFYPLLWQAGGNVFSEDGTSVAFNDEAGQEALEFVQELVDSEFVPESLLTSPPQLEQTPMAQGKVACLLSDSPPIIMPFWGEENIQVLAPLQNEEQMTYGTVGAYSIMDGAEDKDAAAEWVSFLVESGMLEKYDRTTGFFSPRESVTGLYADNPVLGAVEEQLEYAYPGALQPKARDVMGVLAPQIQAALLGEKSASEALDDAADAAAPLLER
jgi:multiple sugar transport system substrate-binding protein